MMHEPRGRGCEVGRGHVSRLMKSMGIRAIWSRPRATVPCAEHKVHPYLLRGLAVGRADHVRASDICCLPMSRGYAYLVAVMDRAGRKALSRRLSNTLDASFRSEALKEAIARHGCPETFNPDRGSRFTSDDFTGVWVANAAGTATVPQVRNGDQTEILTAEGNLEAPAAINGAWIKRAMGVAEGGKVIPGMDSSESPVHGGQESSACNGHFQSVCHHPLFPFNQHGDREGTALRPGNVHSADGFGEPLEPIVDSTKTRTRSSTIGATPPSPRRTAMATWSRKASSTQ